MFDLGTIVATRNFKISVRDPKLQILLNIKRHANGDWGDCGPEDAEANEEALKHGLRLFSIYETQCKQKFYIITEADRSSTTILLPEDY